MGLLLLSLACALVQQDRGGHLKKKGTWRGRGKMGYRIKRYKSLYVKGISSKGILYSTGKYSHCFVIILNRVPPIKKNWITEREKERKTLFKKTKTKTHSLPHQFARLFQTWGFPHSSVGKEPACNARDLGSIPGLGRSPGEGKSYPLQYSAWRIPWTV